MSPRIMAVLRLSVRIHAASALQHAKSEDNCFCADGTHIFSHLQDNVWQIQNQPQLSNLRRLN